MTREETVQRFRECEEKRAEALAAGKSEEEAHDAAKAHWNAWADGMLAKREKLEASNLWAMEKASSKPKNAETHAWMEEALADFSRCLFPVRRAEGTKETPAEVKEKSVATQPAVKSIMIDDAVVDMRGFVFPDRAQFESATFSRTARFDSAAFKGNASFESAKFKGRARFDSATFSGDARFNKATFEGRAWFDSATFSGDARFNNATFSRTALFDSATFEGRAGFDSATFSGDARFNKTTFSDDARFDSATFSGDARFNSATFSDWAWFDSAAFTGNASFTSAASFYKATFSGDARFNNATFSQSTSFRAVKFGSDDKKQDTNFTAIKVERAFDLRGACFSKVPNFCQADFKQAPDLDSVRFPRPAFWRAGNSELIPMYPARRRMAIQGADYEREQMAFKGELRSRRGVKDGCWNLGLWLGILYDGVADCGRSIILPFAVWAASIIAFAVFYWAAAGAKDRCTGHGPFVQAVQALYLSAKNALVLFAGTRDDRVTQAYECLYNSSAEQRLHIPACVTFVETLLQFPISAVLIFLFLLATKNRFKIK